MTQNKIQWVTRVKLFSQTVQLIQDEAGQWKTATAESLDTQVNQFLEDSQVPIVACSAPQMSSIGRLPDSSVLVNVSLSIIYLAEQELPDGQELSGAAERLKTIVEQLAKSGHIQPGAVFRAVGINPSDGSVQ